MCFSQLLFQVVDLVLLGLVGVLDLLLDEGQNLICECCRTFRDGWINWALVCGREVGFEEELAQGCNVDLVVLDLVSEFLDEGAHFCLLNQDGMYVDAL